MRTPSMQRLFVTLQAAGLGVVACVASAAAQEVRADFGLEALYTTNYLSRSSNAPEATYLRLRPGLLVLDPYGRLTYQVDYDGGYEWYLDRSGLNAWENRLFVRGAYDLSARTEVSAQTRFRDISSLRFSEADIESGDTVIGGGRDRYFRNNFKSALRHDLTRLWRAEFGLDHDWVDFRNARDRNNSWSVSGRGSLSLLTAATDRVGVGAGYTHQEFETAGTRLGSTAEVVNGFVSWVHSFSDDTVLTVSGGPSWVSSDAAASTLNVTSIGGVVGAVPGTYAPLLIASCTGALESTCTAVGAPIATPATATLPLSGPQVRNDSQITFFGGVDFEGRFYEDWEVEAGYSRRESSASGEASASSLDRAHIELEWYAQRHWSLFGAFAWDRRRTLTALTGIADFTVVDDGGGLARRTSALTRIVNRKRQNDHFTAILGTRRQLSKQLNASVEVRYHHIRRQRDVLSSGDTDIVLALLNVTYDLPPFRF